MKICRRTSRRIFSTTLRRVRVEIGAHLDDAGRGEKLREGLFFAITGAPNVGKSTLINALSERDVAIVSPLPGTTRDALETRVILGGVPVTLVDTAGLRETTDWVEAEGVRRALARARMLIWSSAWWRPVHRRNKPPSQTRVGRQQDRPGLERPRGRAADQREDRRGDGRFARPPRPGGAGVTETTGPPPLTRARHRAALRSALTHLDAAEEADLPELRGEDLRLAMREVGRITGHVGVEDILDSVFSQFCIGK